MYFCSPDLGNNGKGYNRAAAKFVRKELQGKNAVPKRCFKGLQCRRI